jgi:hypothetical protein
MQPYCRARVRRGERVEECGRVLSTAGRCDREPLHVPAKEPS